MRRFDTVFPNITVADATIDFPEVTSKSSVFEDVALSVGTAPLGTAIIAAAPITTATTIDDLIIQVVIVAADTLRVTLQNPTAGAINPDSIDFRFVFSNMNGDLI
jgi:hypothetical protein